MKIKEVVLDYETRSETDVRTVGAVKYAQHPSTHLLCMGYKIDDRPARVWTPRDPEPEDFFSAVNNGALLIAHNAIFEQSITEFVLRRDKAGQRALPHLPPQRWKCTAAKAAACALPRSLDGVTQALNLAVKKDMEGNRLVKKHMKPTPKWKKWNLGGRVGPEPEKWHTNELELWAIYEYCQTDVEAEYLVDKTLPDLSPYERQVWILNQYQNLRGVQVDVFTVRKILELIEHHTNRLQSQVPLLTGGAVSTVNQRNAILAWLKESGIDLPSLNAKTVAETLAAMDDKDCSEYKLLEIRKALGKSSTKKFQAMVTRAGADGRVRDLTMYHGASTGRESGTGIQVHNFPKGKIKDQDFAIELIQDSAASDTDVAFLEAMTGRSLMEIFSSVARGMVTATPGYTMYAADYNAIECRVLNWMAGNEEVLKDFRDGQDLYVKMAKRVGSDDRQLGKTIELASGYQMGAKRLFQTCIDWGVNGGKGITMELAEKAIEVYRDSHALVVKMWSNLERAAINAVRKPGTTFKINKTEWCFEDGFLWCRLPSGRRLAYYGPTVKNEPAPWGALMPKLYHWYVNSLTKKWENGPTYGGLLTENVVQAASRDIMVQGVRNITKAGYEFLFSVHDEIVGERMDGGSVEEFETLLTTLPDWAKGLPIAAEGWAGKRYKK